MHQFMTHGRLPSVVIPALVGTLFTLISLCYASPPDPTWIAGLYDDADHDDVVLEVLDTVAVPTAAIAQMSAPVAIRETPWFARRTVSSPQSLTAVLDRSPPLA